MNSGQSHKLAVGSTVRLYTTAEMANESHAMRVLSLEKVVCCIKLAEFFGKASNNYDNVAKELSDISLTFINE
jgi:hypothetical protein